MIYKKVSPDKLIPVGGKTGVRSFIAWFLILFGGFGFIGCLSDGESAVSGAIVGLIFLSGGILLLRKVKKTKKLAAKYKKYIDLAIDQNITSIDNIASAVSQVAKCEYCRTPISA